MRQFSLLSRYIQINSWMEWVAIATMLLITFFAFSFYDATDPRRWFVVALFGLIIVLDLWSAAPSARPIGRGYSEQQVESVRLAIMTGATLCLIALDVNFTALIILYFIFSARALLIFPNWVGYGWVLLFGLITTVFITRITWPVWQYGLLNGLGATCGYFFMGSAANAQRRAELASAESQRLLGELQAVHLQLQRYAAHAEALAVAEERNRLAREMHDTLGHRLTVAAVQLEGAHKLVARDPAKAETMIATVREQVVEGLTELRQTVAALREPIETELPLGAALTRLANSFMTATSITTELYLPDHIPDLPAVLRQALYRAAQEALTNIQRHAHASHAQIKVALLGDEKIAAGLIDTEILISIADNGRGLAAGASTRGYGLRGLEERATQLGGRLTIRSDGSGTRIVMTLPLPIPAAVQQPANQPGGYNG